MTAIACAAAAVLVREGVDYVQSKAVFKAARARAGLYAAPERRGGVHRPTVEEELRFLNQAYAQDGKTGLTLQTLLETGARASELVQLRVEGVSLAERVVTIQQGKGDKRRRCRSAATWRSCSSFTLTPAGPGRCSPAGVRRRAAHPDPAARRLGRPRRGPSGRDHQARLPAPAAAHRGHAAAGARNGHHRPAALLRP